MGRQFTSKASIIAPLSTYGDLRNTELSPVFQGNFEYTVDNTELTINAVTGSGTVTQSDAMAVVSTGTTTGSTACLTSKRLLSNHSGLGSLMRFSTLFDTPVAGTEQFQGPADITGSSAAFKNGLMPGYVGETFGFQRFVNDTLVTVAQADWDDPLDGNGRSGMTLIHTNLNEWEVGYQDGAGDIVLFVEDDQTGEFIPVHTIVYVNENTVPHTYNSTYHFTMWADNKATASDLTIKSASYGGFIEGKTKQTQVHQPQFPTSPQTQAMVTTETVIFTLRVKTTYASKDNFIEILMEGMGASIEANAANNLGIVKIIKNATITAPSYTDINTTDSVVEIDTVGTISGGKLLFSLPLSGKNDDRIIDLTPYDFLLLHGETITVTGTSANSATINAGGFWKELF
jgi:hypothetical protein